MELIQGTPASNSYKEIIHPHFILNSNMELIHGTDA